MSHFLKIIKSIFLALALAYIVKHKLKILARSSKNYLVFTTLVLIVLDLRNLFVYKYVSIDDIEHASYFIEFLAGIDEPQRIEVIDTA